MMGLSCFLQIFAPEWHPWGVLPTDPLNPIIVLASGSCFVFFSSLTVRRSTFRFARHTSRIYLIHIVVLQAVKVIMLKIKGEFMAPAIRIPLTVISALFISTLYSILITNMSEKQKEIRKLRGKSGNKIWKYRK